MKFRKKVHCVEAIQFTKELALELFKNPAQTIFGLRPSGAYSTATETVWSAYVCIPTDNGLTEAKLGDWILKGIDEKLYPCPENLFEELYEKVE